MDALLLSFGVIFVAELGDKSQLMALAFATRYKALPVLAGITIATAVVHALSVVVGASVGAAFPTDVTSVVAGVAFLGFGLWTLRGDSLSAEEAARAHRSTRSAVVAASSADSESPRRVHSPKPRNCLLYTSPSPRDKRQSRMPSSA